jgi:hypothetical protein
LPWLFLIDAWLVWESFTGWAREFWQWVIDCGEMGNCGDDFGVVMDGHGMVMMKVWLRV